MEERLPSQIYVIGNFLLLIVVVLALAMMPRAMALDPREFGSPTRDEQFEQAAGLQPLGATGLPELRIWSASQPEASGVLVTPAAIERYDLSRTNGGHFQLRHRDREATPAAAQAIRRLRELAAYDSHYMICRAVGGSVSVSGYVDGREFTFREAGDCTGARAPVVEELFKLIARKD